MIVRAARDDLGRLARRQQLRRGERAHVVGLDDLAIRMSGELADDLAFDDTVFRGVRRRVPIACNTHLLSPNLSSIMTLSAVGFTTLTGVPARNCTTFSMLWLIMRADASTVLHADTGVITTFSIVRNGWPAGSGSCLEHIEARAADLPALQCTQQCGFVDHATAGGVDQDRASLHAGKLIGADHVACRVIEPHMQRDHVGGREQLVERHRLRSDRGGARRIVVARPRDHLHAEARARAAQAPTRCR